MTTENEAAATPGDGGEQAAKRFEIVCGTLIAVIAAILAITDLFAGKYGDDELLAHAQKSNAYLWYQSKGIKETLVEGQRDTLKTLVAAGSIREEQLPAVQGLVTKLDTRIERYGNEKNEILNGSAKVGRDKWAQEVDGKLGNVTGAKEWEAQAEVLGNAGDLFDYSALFLQLSLVLGAISLVLQGSGPRRAFFALMLVLGLVGSGFAVAAFRAVSSI
jgi:hypothetical protein